MREACGNARRMSLQVLSCKLPANEFIVEGVTIEPYVLLHRPDAAGPVTADEIPEEGTGNSRYSLRFRYAPANIPTPPPPLSNKCSTWSSPDYYYLLQ